MIRYLFKKLTSGKTVQAIALVDADGNQIVSGGGGSTFWSDDGTDLTPLTDGRNIDVNTGGLKDNDVTTAVMLGDATNSALITTNKTLIGSINGLDAIHLDTKEPSGFTEPENIIVTYSDITKTITLTGTVKAYWRGTIISTLITGWESPALTDTYAAPNSGGYFLYYDGTAFIWSTIPWTFDMVQIAYAYYRSDGTFIFALRETHGTQDFRTHVEFHNTIGTYKVSGGTLSNYTLSSTTTTDRRPANDATVIADEDISTSLPSRLGANYTHANMTGASTIISDWNNSEIIKVLANRPYWNEFSGGTWGQTLLSNNAYTSIWVIAFPSAADSDSQRYNFFHLQGQSEGTFLEQSLLVPQDVNIGALADISPEFIFLNQIIIQYTGGNWTIDSVVNLSGNRYFQIGFPTGNFMSSVASNVDQFSGVGLSSDPLELTGITYPLVDAVDAVQIRKADGTTPIINIDTINNRLGIGTTTPDGILDTTPDAITATSYSYGTRVTNTQMLALTGMTSGAKVYNLTTLSDWAYNGTIWNEEISEAKVIELALIYG